MSEFSWTPELIEKAMKAPIPKYKYLVTNDKAEFIKRMDHIIEAGHEKGGDNLSYLESLVEEKV